MFRNLKAEMIRQNVSIKDIANLLNIKVGTARAKINGKIGVSLEDCKKIITLFNENNTIDYLFKKAD
jgi:hypothetical protein